MSTLAFPLLHHNVDQDTVTTQKTQELPDSKPVAAVSGHNGELAFRRHVSAIFNGFMAATALITAFYVGLLLLYFKLQ